MKTTTDERIANTVLALSQYCQRVVGDRIAQGSVQCLVCHQHVPTKKMSVVVNHVVRHFQKTIFACRLCEYGSRRRVAMICHLKNKHGKMICGQTCNDRRTEYIDEIKAIIDYCFASTIGLEK